MKTHEFERIVDKLKLETRNAGDRLAWFVYDGQTVVRTKRSHGNKEQPGDKIRQQLKLNEQQLAGLISCTVSFEDYVGILKDKGIIAKPVVKIVECPDCHGKQTIRFSPARDAAQEESQSIPCFHCKKPFDVPVSGKIIGGPVPA